MVSTAMYRKALEIVNRGHVWNEGNGVFTVFRRDIGTARQVTSSTNAAGATIYRSNGRYNRETNRTDTYITAVKLAQGLSVEVSDAIISRDGKFIRDSPDSPWRLRN